MKRGVLFLVALVGTPMVWVFFLCGLKTLLSDVASDAFFSLNRILFASGCAVMTVLYFWKARSFSFLYVFAHEMTHALVGLCCFAKIHKMSVSSNNGFVMLSKRNLLITLSPYCVPFFLLCAMVLYLLVQCFFPDVIPFSVWAFIFGILTAFHVLYTADALLTVSQPDTLEYGRCFSWWLIVSANFFFALLAITLTSPRTSFSRQAHEVFATTCHTYSKVYRVVRDGVTFVMSHVTSDKAEVKK